VELLASHEGPFVQFLTDLGVWAPGGLAFSFGQVVQSSSNARRLLLIHCNYLSTDLHLPPTATVVYCPRTHAAFGHPPHPFRDFLARGVRVALGTDSLASNPDLDLLGEARFLHQRYPDVPGATVLRMATLSGAEALGWADETGSLEAGKSADLAVVPLPDHDNEAHALVLGSDNKVSRVMARGRWLVP
jgi:cytosine/adenosine deaminase-related metal-dependent hydrolase